LGGSIFERNGFGAKIFNDDVGVGWIGGAFVGSDEGIHE
jgi:hypothetical protein